MEERWNCCICLSKPIDTFTECGHSACWECFQGVFQEASPRCPIERKPIDESKVTRIFNSKDTQEIHRIYECSICQVPVILPSEGQTKTTPIMSKAIGATNNGHQISPGKLYHLHCIKTVVIPHLEKDLIITQPAQSSRSNQSSLEEAFNREDQINLSSFSSISRYMTEIGFILLLGSVHKSLLFLPGLTIFVLSISALSFQVGLYGLASSAAAIALIILGGVTQSVPLTIFALFSFSPGYVYDIAVNHSRVNDFCKATLRILLD